jgi:hypothetical protein
MGDFSASGDDTTKRNSRQQRHRHSKTKTWEDVLARTALEQRRWCDLDPTDKGPNMKGAMAGKRKILDQEPAALVSRWAVVGEPNVEFVGQASLLWIGL